ncbi:hypothetical protein ACINK0_05340 [Deinococcus sp. VB343]|uniref:hypothetical protein n=1 Tax=Deinococcus sp. VB343 TaxID=3385567 RepID=UPI0039C9A865
MNREHRRAVLLLGVLVLGPGLLLALLGHQAVVSSSWSGPPETRWAGTELREMNVLGHKGMVRGQFLELRCRRLPVLKTRTRDGWFGPEWRGKPVWEAGKLTYQPGWEGARPRVDPVSLGAPLWLNFCPR